MLDTKTDIVLITGANTGPRSRGLTAARYVEEVLEGHVRPLAWLVGEDFRLKTDLHFDKYSSELTCEPGEFSRKSRVNGN